MAKHPKFSPSTRQKRPKPPPGSATMRSASPKESRANRKRTGRALSVPALGDKSNVMNTQTVASEIRQTARDIADVPRDFVRGLGVHHEGRRILREAEKHNQSVRQTRRQKARSAGRGK